MNWTWWVAVGLLVVWGAGLLIYASALLLYIMHNRNGLDRDDTLDVMVDNEKETSDE